MLLGVLLATVAPRAQQPEPCGTMEHHQMLLARHPEFGRDQHAIEAQTLAFVAQGPTGEDTLRRIPVVVHVLWNTTLQNIPDSQILSQIQVLNEDFRRANADAGNTAPQFQGVAADSEFEFCLANVDPQGNPTTGITRTQTNVTVFSPNDNGAKFTATGGRDAWPRDQYLNIWVCTLVNGLLGYAQFPGGPANTDGVVITTQAFGRTGNLLQGYMQGRTTTHEVGHWLNLRHIWGDQQPNCADDFVADTPPADQPHFGCQVGISSCGAVNMVQNYMDYSEDACKNLFTQGQKSRMQALFAPGGARVSLLSSSGICGSTPPPAPTGPFQSNQPLSSLTLNGVAGTATQPAVVTVAAGVSVAANFASTGTGRPWDTLLSFSPLVGVGNGALTTPGGQILNVNAAAPYVWLNSGTASAYPVAFPGNFTVPATPTVAATFSLQQFIVTPAVPDGYALSQGCQLVATAPTGGCTISLPAGPTGDDSSVVVNLSGGTCSVPFGFYGTSYTRFLVNSNGRITFQAADTAFGPTVATAASGRPFVGFWTDLDPSVQGSITITRPSASRFRTAWANVRYYGETPSCSFAIELDASNGAVVLDGLASIPGNPETQALNNGQNQFLGLSRGAGATVSFLTYFAPGSSGAASNATDMLFDYYDAATQFGGLCPSLQTSLNRVTFTPAANGNYSWIAN